MRIVRLTKSESRFAVVTIAGQIERWIKVSKTRLSLRSDGIRFASTAIAQFRRSFKQRCTLSKTLLRRLRRHTERTTNLWPGYIGHSGVADKPLDGRPTTFNGLLLIGKGGQQ